MPQVKRHTLSLLFKTRMRKKLLHEWQDCAHNCRSLIHKVIRVFPCAENIVTYLRTDLQIQSFMQMLLWNRWYLYKSKPESPIDILSLLKNLHLRFELCQKILSYGYSLNGDADALLMLTYSVGPAENKLAKLGDAIAISNLKLSITHSLTDPLTDWLTGEGDRKCYRI